MIPKIIWQTHENKYNDLEPFQKNIINTWKNLNSGWKHFYVSAEERKQYIKDYDSFLYDCYMASSGINQADIWRLVVLYQNGGIYADMDSVCYMPIDQSFKDGYSGEDIICTPKGFQSDFINNSNFGSVKNSKTIKLILDKVILIYKDVLSMKKISINELTDGDPCWALFSKVVSGSSDIYYNKEYFIHSKDYKSGFNSNYEVFYNREKIIYNNLATINNWNI